MLIRPSVRLHLVAEPHMLMRVSVSPLAQQSSTSMGLLFNGLKFALSARDLMNAKSGAT
jgi:hypothetical protein